MFFAKVVLVALALTLTSCGLPSDEDVIAAQNAQPAGELSSWTDPVPTVPESIPFAEEPEPVQTPESQQLHVWVLAVDVVAGQTFMDIYDAGGIVQKQVPETEIVGVPIKDLATIQGFIVTADTVAGNTIVDGTFSEWSPEQAVQDDSPEDVNPRETLEVTYFALQEIEDFPSSDSGFETSLYVGFDTTSTSGESAADAIAGRVVPLLEELGFRHFATEGRLITMVYGTCGFAQVIESGPKTIRVVLQDAC